MKILKLKNTDITTINEDKKQAIKSATEEFNSATKLIDMYEYKDGIAELKEEFKDKQDIFEFKQKVRGASHKLHGIYNKEDKGTIENTMLGSALMQFRRWMPAGYVNRFGSRGTPFKVEAFWNEKRGEYDLGTYSSLLKYLGTPLKDKTLWDTEKPVINATLDMLQTVFKKNMDISYLTIDYTIIH